MEFLAGALDAEAYHGAVERLSLADRVKGPRSMED